MTSKSGAKTLFAAVATTFAAMALAGCVTVNAASNSSASSETASDTASSETSASTNSASSETSANAGGASGSSSASSASGSSNAGVAFNAASALSAAASNAAASSPSASSASSDAGAQKVGNAKVGYIQVPATWEDRISDQDPNVVDSYEMAYYVNPDSAYNSVALGHASYSEAIQMTVAPTSYVEIAQGIYDGFSNNATQFSGTDRAEITIGGKNAIIITSMLTDDGLQLATIVIDRDGDGSAAVALTMNCGMDAAAASRVLQCASTWTF